MEERFFLHGVTRQSSYVAEGDPELSFTIEPDFADASFAVGNEAAMTARKTTQLTVFFPAQLTRGGLPLQHFRQFRISFCGCVQQHLIFSRIAASRHSWLIKNSATHWKLSKAKIMFVRPWQCEGSCCRIVGREAGGIFRVFFETSQYKRMAASDYQL
ncbi:hypothetical protein SDC9_210181 [bioreactor metagenome]|uniref:Uncharacterized protein n=1 Tax=bioreactor metagenome TaxID=1076179 RepID=A0A645JSW0_9ZZZZ